MKRMILLLALVVSFSFSFGSVFAKEVEWKNLETPGVISTAAQIKATVPPYFTCIEACKEAFFECARGHGAKIDSCIKKSVECRVACDEASKAEADKDTSHSSSDYDYWYGN